MRAILRYFRQHPWQRRAMTSSLAMMVGALAAIVLYPVVRDHMLINDLGGDDIAARRQARSQLRNLVSSSPKTLERLEDAMDTDSDTKFAAIASLLRSLNAFNKPGRSGLWVDRLNAIELSQSAALMPDDTATRWMLLAEILLDGRDNRYVRRALGTAIDDRTPFVRTLAGVLAGRLADDKALATLLNDSDATVASSAAMSIAAASRSLLSPAVMAMLIEANDRERISSAAWAATRLAPKQAGAQLQKMFASGVNDAKLRDRLLHVLEQSLPEVASGVIGQMMPLDDATDDLPPAKAILAAGRLGRTLQAANIQRVLRMTSPADQLTEGHLLAALQAAEMLKLPCRQQADMICRKLWGPEHHLLLTAAARVLGRQLDTKQSSDTPSREHSIETLRLAAGYVGMPTSQPAASQPTDSQDEFITTPLPSAAAAVALWLGGEDPDDKLIRLAAGSETTLPGDYIAWHVSREAPADRAFALGMAMLPPFGAPLGKRVFNDNERSTGAMLLALAARTSDQKRRAIERITQRLKGNRGFYTAGALRCALLILDSNDQLDQVHGLLSSGEFPQRRAMTALCVAGDRQAMDWLLFNRHVSDEDVATLLTTRGIGEVIAAAGAELPRVDLAARGDLRLWQVRIMRNFWGVRRASIKLGLRR